MQSLLLGRTRSSTKLRAILWVVLLLPALAVLAWLLFRSTEPTYQGKALTAWLRERSVGPSQEAESAIRQIGTNALPTLLKMVLETNSHDQDILLRLTRRQSVLAFDFKDASEDHNLAAVGFSVLGPTAKPAVAALTNLVTAPDPVVRRTSIGCLLAMGPAAQDAVPALISEITDTDPVVRGSAKLALGAIHSQAAIAVPALIANLSAMDGSKRLTVLALGKFGAEANVAVPALLPLLNDPDRGLRSATSNALKQIDSEAATKAGVR